MNKKGLGLKALYPAVLVIIIVGIMLGVGIFVLDETSEAISTTLESVSNETMNMTNPTSPLTVSNSGECGFSNLVVTAVTNYSNSEEAIIDPSEYTVNADAGTIINTTGTYADEWNVSYTYFGSGGEDDYCTVLETSITGIGGLASWIAVIVVVIAAAVVLGIVINSFGKKSAV